MAPNHTLFFNISLSFFSVDDSCPTLCVVMSQFFFWLGLGTTWATSSGGPAISRRKSARSFGVLCAILDALLDLLGHLECRVAFTTFFFEKSRTFVKSGLLKTLQQFALKTNDNFGFFFGMMHRPDTSIRGAWNAAGDDSECYNPTMKPPSNHNSN